MRDASGTSGDEACAGCGNNFSDKLSGNSHHLRWGRIGHAAEGGAVLTDYIVLFVTMPGGGDGP